METKRSWVWRLLGRAAIHAIIGALVCGVLGALLIALSGVSVGAILDASMQLRGPHEMAGLGGAFGLVLGGGGGGIVGLMTLGIMGFISPPGLSYWPPRDILFRVVAGMVLTTAGIMSSFYILTFVIAVLSGTSFEKSVGDGLLYIMFGAPAIMVCGLIAGAVRGMRVHCARIDMRSV